VIHARLSVLHRSCVPATLVVAAKSCYLLFGAEPQARSKHGPCLIILLWQQQHV
jgi:hypothetical protein